jgi:hypothetical protein
MKKSILFFVVLLNGCITPVHFDGKTATYQHHEIDFKGAMLQAKELCAKEGKSVKHERSDCRANCVSTFSCVEK